MNSPDRRPTEQPSRPECRDDADAMSVAERRFRDTARHIVLQLDIEEAMWQLLEKEPER